MILCIVGSLANSCIHIQNGWYRGLTLLKTEFG